MTEPLQLQIAFDCQDPHAVASFWAAALAYDVEDHSSLVESLVATGRMPAAATVEIDGKRQFADIATCTDPNGKRPRLYFQRVPETKTVKNRVHLDIHTDGKLEEEVARFIALGATEAWRSDDRGGPCVTMRDPEGNELCLS
jgi:hypothetical protein